MTTELQFVRTYLSDFPRFETIFEDELQSLDSQIEHAKAIGTPELIAQMENARNTFILRAGTCCHRASIISKSSCVLNDDDFSKFKETWQNLIMENIHCHSQFTTRHHDWIGDIYLCPTIEGIEFETLERFRIGYSDELYSGTLIAVDYHERISAMMLQCLFYEILNIDTWQPIDRNDVDREDWFLVDDDQKATDDEDNDQ